MEDIKKKLGFLSEAARGTWVRLLLCSILCSVLLCCLFYYRSRNTAVIGFSLNYEEASRGLNPNGTYFSVYELKSEEILARALELAGVTEITPEELAENISIDLPDDYKDEYVVTQYKGIYKKNRGLNAVRTEDMLLIPNEFLSCPFTLKIGCTWNPNTDKRVLNTILDTIQDCFDEKKV